MIERSASVIIDRPAAEVWAAISDVTRTGEWSPECIAARWLPPSTGPEVGARFEGDNIVKLGPIVLKRWTTHAEVTRCVPGQVFEFVAEGHATWTYELAEDDGATQVTERCSFPDYEGREKLLYGTIARRPDAMQRGMKQTLSRLMAAVEGAAT